MQDNGYINELQDNITETAADILPDEIPAEAAAETIPADVLPAEIPAEETAAEAFAEEIPAEAAPAETPAYLFTEEAPVEAAPEEVPAAEIAAEETAAEPPVYYTAPETADRAPAEEPAAAAQTGGPAISLERELLADALVAVNTLSADRDQLKQYNDTKKKLEKDLNTLTRNIEKEKTDTIRSKRQEIESGYNKQIKDVEREIGDISDQRQKARSVAVRERIKANTDAPRQEIAGIRENMKAFVKEQQAPGIMASRLYYTLFSPLTIADWIVDILLAAAGVGAIVLAYMKQAGVLTFLCVLGVVVALAVIYVVISAKTKEKYHDVMVACKNMFREIALREKSISQITKNIQDDKDDSVYDLGGFDSQIQAKNQQKEALGAQKTGALEEFDNVTKGTITDGIDAKYAEDISVLQRNIAENAEAVSTFTERVAADEGRLKSEYAQRIGQKNLSRDKIERMIGLFDRGEASSISEAASKMK